MKPGNDPDPKHEELRKRDALHPRPDQVTDELFAIHEFFDARDAIQVKYEMLRRVRVDGYSVVRAVETHGYTRSTFYEARAAFERDGLSGLLPRKRGPRRAHKLAPEVMAFVAAQRSNTPSLSASVLAEAIHGRFGVRVHPRSVERALARKKKGS